MSTFGDYKAYKQYSPAYDMWKAKRNLAEAKRQEYLRLHPEEINPEDVQRGKSLMRAIDIMDEYSQKRAEDMEVATETAAIYGVELAMGGGGALGYMASRLKPVQKFFAKYGKTPKMQKAITTGVPIAIGAVAGLIASFPIYAWAAKTEIGASRKGRFEAMRKELNNPNGFAVLTEEQQNEARQIAQTISFPKEKKLSNQFKDYKALFGENTIYNAHRKAFELQLAEDEKHINDEMSPDEIENAKKEQQLLTNLVEKIDIASQDYAENAELATTFGLTSIGACAILFDLALGAILKACKVTSAPKIKNISRIASVIGVAGSALFAAKIQKEAARVGRFKAKQELLNNPAQFTYVDDSKLAEVGDVKVEPQKKQTMVEFLKNIWNDNREYEKYKKGQALEEKKLYKAIEKLELTPEQIEDAKRLQKNTFKTFNKIDENSQRYAESIEALGNAINVPLNLVFGTIGGLVGAAVAMKPLAAGKKLVKSDLINMYAKLVGFSFLSTIPSLIVNAKITKEQKRASRVADMIAINEMQDYRQFKA